MNVADCLTGYCPRRLRFTACQLFFGNLNHCTFVTELNPLKYNISGGGNFMLLLDKSSRDMTGNEVRERETGNGCKPGTLQFMVGRTHAAYIIKVGFKQTV